MWQRPKKYLLIFQRVGPFPLPPALCVIQGEAVAAVQKSMRTLSLMQSLILMPMKM